MPCTQPKQCWLIGKTENGKDKYVFKQPDASHRFKSQKVACGKCISCKMSRASEWATRAYHESQCHLHNCFITLTYAPEKLPENESLQPLDLKNFIRRLRDHIKPMKIKYLACGEYGRNPKTGDIQRPHYHLCIFGYDFPDKYYFFSNKLGQPVYRSNTLETLWEEGISSIAQMTYETAAYTARYTIKKQTEQEKYEHVNVDPETGEILDDHKYERVMKRLGKTPEFIRMSNGIGKNWYKEFKQDTKKDYLKVNYKKHKIPRYYDKLHEKDDPASLIAIKEQRRKQAEKSKDNTKDRLKSKDIIIKQSLTKLPRGLDNG